MRDKLAVAGFLLALASVVLFVTVSFYVDGWLSWTYSGLAVASYGLAMWHMPNALRQVNRWRARR